MDSDPKANSMSGPGVPNDAWNKRATELQYSQTLAEPFIITTVAGGYPTEQTSDTAARWTRVQIDRAPMIGRPVSGPRVVYYTPVQPRDGDVALGKYIVAPDGVCKFPATGHWWVYFPGTLSTSIKYVVFDPGATPLTPEIAREQGSGAGGSQPCMPAINQDCKTVTAANTATQMTAYAVTGGYLTVVKADPTNTDYIYVAGSQSCADPTRCAFPLAPGEELFMNICNWNEIWFTSPSATAKLFCIVEAPVAKTCS